MFNGRSTIFRILAALLLIAILVGAGVVLYQTGFSQGYAQAALTTGSPGASPSQPIAPGYPYGAYWWGPHFGFFPFFPLFGLFFFGLLLFFLIRIVFFPFRWGYGRGWRSYAPDERDRRRDEGNQPGDSNRDQG